MNDLTHFIRQYQMSFRVVSDDITNVLADAVVVAANTALWLGSGMAQSIIETGGASIQREAETLSPIPLGDAVSVRAGTLVHCQELILAAVLDFGEADVMIRKATVNALHLAHQHEHQSIAFPALGTGVGNRTSAFSAREMLLGVKQYCNDVTNPTVRMIIFVVTDEPNFSSFNAAVSSIKNGNEPETLPVALERRSA